MILELMHFNEMKLTKNIILEMLYILKKQNTMQLKNKLKLPTGKDEYEIFEISSKETIIRKITKDKIQSIIFKDRIGGLVCISSSYDSNLFGSSTSCCVYFVFWLH